VAAQIKILFSCPREYAVVIIAVLYLILLWLVFSKLKLVRWGWFSGTVAVLIGIVILAVFVALLNNLAPSGRITIVSPVIEVTPNVSGQVTAIPVKTNLPVKAGAVLFQIDPAPFQYKVTQLEAALVAAQQNAEVLKANYEQQSANVAALTAQVQYHQKRLSDLQSALHSGAETEFRIQDTQNQATTADNQLQAALAAQRSAKLALDSQVGGINTSVIQTREQLDDAKWELTQTTVRAPADGTVTVMALTVGDRALQARAAMSFLITSEITIVGLFPQNGFRAIKPGAEVQLVLDNDPGRLHKATVIAIPEGVGQGQIAVSGTLARTTAIGGATTFPAEISIPAGVDRGSLRLGISGTATVFAKDAGVIGIVAWVLLWVSSYTAYL
jgi:multidrug resistance efflux pump